MKKGGYLPLITIGNLLCKVGLECSNEDFLQDLSKELSNQSWIRKGVYSLSKDEELQYSWENFSERVMHETRFVFFKDSIASNYLVEPEPYRILENIGRIVVEMGLTQRLLPNTRIVRARQHESALILRNALDLGPPSKEFATQNRMSPAGIPMFHGAVDEKTAFKEIYRFNPKETKMTFAEFKTLHPLHLLDLTDIPPIPSFFDKTHADKRPALIFMYDFEKNVTRCIDRDDEMHYRYVPTQIVAEYFRHIFVLPHEEMLDGILFNSSKNLGGICYSLFMDSNDCTDIKENRSKILLLCDHYTVDIDFKNETYG